MSTQIYGPYLNGSNRANFNGYLVKVASNLYPPWFFGRRSLKNKTFIPTGGSSYDFLMYMAEYFNFTFEIYDQNNEFGLEARSDGSHPGLIGSLLSGETDFAMGGMTMRLLCYNSKIKSSEMVESERVTYMTLVSEPVEVRGTIFMPFDTISWICILISVAVFTICAHIFKKVCRTHFELQWLAICSFLQRGPHRSPHGMGVNFLMQVCWWSGFVLLSSYGTSIISSLSNDRKLNNIQSLEQFLWLVENKRVLALITGETTYSKLFQLQDNRVYQILKNNNRQVSHYALAVQHMIINRKSPKQTPLGPLIQAVIGPYKYLNLWANTLGDEYFFLKDDDETSIFTDFYSLIFPDNTTLIPAMNRCIRNIQQYGFYSKWYFKKYKIPHTVDDIEMKLKDLNLEMVINLDKNKDDGPSALSLENVSELFIVYLDCLSLIILVLLLEIVCKLSKHSKWIRRVKMFIANNQEKDRIAKLTKRKRFSIQNRYDPRSFDSNIFELQQQTQFTLETNYRTDSLDSIELHL